MKLPALLILVIQIGVQSPLQPARTAEKASIEGIVLRSVSGEPLTRAELKLTPVGPENQDGVFIKGGPGAAESIPTVLTENTGRFLLKDLEPGQYRLTVSRNGYAPQTYGRKSSSGPGAIINLAAGEKLSNIVFRLVPAGIITGRVRDSSGEPVPGYDVILLKASYNGERQSLAQEDVARTDDRGEYRFYWIPPGRYYVRVNRPQPNTFGTRTIVIEKTISSAFYPGVLEASSASVVELGAGAEIGAVDVVLPNATGYRIRGRLVEASTGKPPKSASVAVRPKRIERFEYAFEQTDETQYNPRTGEFEIRNVVPGSYWLTASVQAEFNAPIPPERLAEVRTGADVFEAVFWSGAAAEISLEMNAADVNDMVLVLTKGTTIPVRLGIEGAELASVKGADDIRVSLAPEASGPNYRQSTRLIPDGTARIENVLPGQYRIDVDHPASANLYVKEILYGRSDALTTPIQITEQSPSGISVLLSTKGGQVEGRLTDALSQPVSGVEVVLIPDDRERSRLFKTAVTDREGSFIFRAVTPGGYKVFSWEDLESREYYDKQILLKYETQGRPVRVQELSKESIDLKIIPAPQP
jgi:hypothetical protein